jgi:zinc finger protein
MGPDPDGRLKIEYYERSWEQMEELGLNDMKVDGESETKDDQPEGASAT